MGSRTVFLVFSRVTRERTAAQPTATSSVVPALFHGQDADSPCFSSVFCVSGTVFRPRHAQLPLILLTAPPNRYQCCAPILGRETEMRKANAAGAESPAHRWWPRICNQTVSRACGDYRPVRLYYLRAEESGPPSRAGQQTWQGAGGAKSNPKQPLQLRGQCGAGSALGYPPRFQSLSEASTWARPTFREGA